MTPSARPLARPLRSLLTGLGLLFTGLGILGVLLPGLPGTVFFVLAAACFSRASPKFEAWLLALPLAGPLLRDYQAGLGMPRRAKWLACGSVLLAVGFSLGRIPSLVGQLVWAAVGLVGLLYICFFVRTRA